MKKSTHNPTVRIGFREPIAARRSALTTAAFMYNKAQSNRVIRRVIKPDHYYIMYILSGSGTYDDPLNGSLPVNEGDAIVTFPGLEHSYGPTRAWDEAYLGLQGPIFTQLEAEGLMRRDCPILSPGAVPALKSSVMSLVEDFIREQPLSNPVQTARAHMLLAQMIDAHLAARASQPGGDFVRRACALLEQDLERDLDMEQVARRFGFGYERFRKLFAEETGASPARYRILRRIDHAKTMLLEGHLPVKLIAEKLGYCDVYFFARQFKQVTGRTPHEFRRV
jgi:AraC-like DNA-binding protein